MKGYHVSWKRLSLVLALFLILSSPVFGAVVQKGDVIVATAYPIFYQVGGDPASHMAGLPLLAQTMFERIVEVKLDGKSFLPALAKTWKVSPDWKFIEFDLRNDVPFHNGEMVTAQDIKYSLETYMRSELRYVHGKLWQKNIKEVVAESPTKLKIHMNIADPGLIGRLWWGAGIFPKAYREKVGDKGFAEKPIGAGPFKWVGYKQDQYWQVEAVKSHYRKTPEIKSLKLIFVQDHSTRLAMLQAREADIVDLAQANIPMVKSSKDLRIVYSMYPNLTNLLMCDLQFPNEPSPFLDRRVRTAASLAIDRKAICEKVLFGSAEPYGEILSPITMGHDPSIKPDSYDPERAKKLLAEAGFPKGFNTTINTTPTAKFWVEAIAANLNEVGIKTKIDIYEGGAWQALIHGKKARGIITAGAWHHAELHAAADMSDWLTSMPWSFHTPPEVEKVITEGAMAIKDRDVIAVGKKISKTIREAQYRIILWAIHNPYGVGPKIKHWQPITGSQPAASFEYIQANY
ncbi:MAG: ABC transporter substrate-binding protein [Deltaproteobacteria bacterium]|nr:ABC transporter substrate-binding protein [Deltaproteobacteria bacterium]